MKNRSMKKVAKKKRPAKRLAQKARSARKPRSKNRPSGRRSRQTVAELTIEVLWDRGAVPRDCFQEYGHPSRKPYGVYLVDRDNLAPLSAFHWFGTPEELVDAVCRWFPAFLGFAGDADATEKKKFVATYHSALRHLSGRGGWKAARRALASLGRVGPITEIVWLGSLPDLCRDKDRFSADAREVFWDNLESDMEDDSDAQSKLTIPKGQRARRGPLAPEAWEQFADSVVSG